jgi:hypothetical protein
MGSIQEFLKQKKLQLLRDVETRWSSTFLMIERCLLLREVGTYAHIVIVADVMLR